MCYTTVKDKKSKTIIKYSDFFLCYLNCSFFRQCGNFAWNFCQKCADSLTTHKSFIKNASNQPFNIWLNISCLAIWILSSYIEYSTKIVIQYIPIVYSKKSDTPKAINNKLKFRCNKHVAKCGNFKERSYITILNILY